MEDLVKEFIEKAKMPEPDGRCNRVIFDFNQMLHSGKMKPIDCYRWLEKKQKEEEDEFEKEHGFHIDLSLKYLYPEIMGLDEKYTYEEWLNSVKERRESFKDWIHKKNQEIKENFAKEFGEEKLKELEELVKNSMKIK